MATQPRITTGKFGGDDASSYAVFVDGKPRFTGLTKREIPYYKEQAQNHLAFNARIDITAPEFKSLCSAVHYVYTQIGHDLETDEADEIIESCLDAGRLREFDRAADDIYYRTLIERHGYDAVLKTLTESGRIV